MITSMEIRQRRARIVEPIRAITGAENRKLDAVEWKTCGRGEADFRELTERITRPETLEQPEPSGLDRCTSTGRRRAPTMFVTAENLRPCVAPPANPTRRT